MTEAVYEAQGVVKRYHPAQPPATDRIDLQVGAGEVLGILGPNGAGKSTLTRLLVGLLHPDAGQVRLYGQELRSQPRLAPTLVAYLPQAESALADMTVRAALETTARLRGASRPDARSQAATIATELGLEGLLGRRVATLSGGQRRLTGVGTALVGDRPVLVLDEPTTGLDPAARRGVWDALHRRRERRGVTVVLVTHNVLEAETVLDRVVILDRGRVVGCDTPGRLKQQVDGTLRLLLTWQQEPPLTVPAVAALADQAEVTGRRWTLRLPAEQARTVLAELLDGPARASLDDFALGTPSLEDTYLTVAGPPAREHP